MRREGAHRRFHREKGHDLQQVVLDDVTDDAVTIKVAAAALRPEVFAEDHLDVPNVLPAPQRLEHQVGEPQHLFPPAPPSRAVNPPSFTAFHIPSVRPVSYESINAVTTTQFGLLWCDAVRNSTQLLVSSAQCGHQCHKVDAPAVERYASG